MIDFDIEKATKKIQDECSCSEDMAGAMVNQLKKVKSPEMDMYVIGWLNGENPPFEFFGLTSDYMMKKERDSYLGAIFSMSMLLKNPDLIESYKVCNFDRI